MTDETTQDAPQQGAKVSIDGHDYDLGTLSDEVKSSLAGLRACDRKIQALQQELSIVRTARAAYAGAAKNGLPGES